MVAIEVGKRRGSIGLFIEKDVVCCEVVQWSDSEFEGTRSKFGSGRTYQRVVLFTSTRFESFERLIVLRTAKGRERERECV